MFTEKLSKTVLSLLKTIGPVLPVDTYLAGGTALTLHINHRSSFDLDLYCPREFKVDSVRQQLEKQFGFKLVSTSWQTLIGRIKDTEVGLFFYRYSMLKPRIRFESVLIADIDDVLAMKLEAIAGRGLKRDFFDVYSVCLQNKISLNDALKLNFQKFDKTQEHLPHLLKSLTFFDDAEKYSERAEIVDSEWSKVKDFFVNQAPDLSIT